MSHEDLEERVEKLESDMGWFWFFVKGGATILVVIIISRLLHLG